MSSIEFEARILNVKKEELEKKLIELGAIKEKDYNQKRYTYDFPNTNEHKWIRLRQAGEECSLTIKKILSKDKIDGTEELEIKVSNFDMTNKILQELGYEPYNYQENRRTRYYLNGIEIDIDTWPLIPTFVEVEGKSVDEVIDTIALLGKNREDITTLDIQSIYLEKYGIDISKISSLKFENEREK